MQLDTKKLVDEITSSLDLFKKSIGWDKITRKIEQLNVQTKNNNFWDNATLAQRIMSEKSILEKQIMAHDNLKDALKESLEMVELAKSEGDNEILELTVDGLLDLKIKAKKLELEAMLSKQTDINNCFLEIHAGAGGTESCDWAAMLLRMYDRWAKTRGFKVEIVHQTLGDEAGYKSVSMKIIGQFAFGWVKTESGIHRLVRISPFDSSKRRHTSFAGVSVYPEIESTINVEINDKDLKIDTYRASGAGGQHVNTTDSAVRITHIPTGTVAACQSGRSQHKNRAEALKMLRAKLYEIIRLEREKNAADENKKKTEIGWGHQIRSYVLHPYQMVKDTRTNVERGAAVAVLDGDIDCFLQASLVHYNLNH